MCLIVIKEFLSVINLEVIFFAITIRKIVNMWLHKVLLFSTILAVIHCHSPGKRINMEASPRPSFAKYEVLREKLLDEHLSHALGSDLGLNEKEQMFNAMLMEFKMDELSRGFQNPFNFTPSRHFFDVASTVESSPLFKLIRKMPKGNLH